MLFKTLIKVQGFHLDGFRHVNNARYLEFLEAARWDLMEESGITAGLVAEGLGFVVVNININYRTPALLGEILEVRSGLKEVNDHKGTIEQVVVNQKSGKIVADATLIYVVVDFKSGKLAHLSPELLKKTNELIEPAAAE